MIKNIVLPPLKDLLFDGDTTWEANIAFPGMSDPLWVLLDSPAEGPSPSYRKAVERVLDRLADLSALGLQKLVSSTAGLQAGAAIGSDGFQLANLCLFDETAVLAGAFYLEYHHPDDPSGSYQVEYSAFVPTSAIRHQD
jgi:hypothetical protein